MYKHRRLCVIALSIIAVYLSACGGNGEISGSAADPTLGTFSGTTSQGEQIIFTVKDVNGTMTITSIKYNIKMEGPGWSVSTEMVQPAKRDIVISSGSFSGNNTSGNTSEEISGNFFGDEGAEGRLYCSHEHPQGLGTATADVTFVVYKTVP